MPTFTVIISFHSAWEMIISGTKKKCPQLHVSPANVPFKCISFPEDKWQVWQKSIRIWSKSNKSWGSQDPGRLEGSAVMAAAVQPESSWSPFFCSEPLNYTFHRGSSTFHLSLVIHREHSSLLLCCWHFLFIYFLAERNVRRYLLEIGTCLCLVLFKIIWADMLHLFICDRKKINLL